MVFQGGRGVRCRLLTHVEIVFLAVSGEANSVAACDDRLAVIAA